MQKGAGCSPCEIHKFQVVHHMKYTMFMHYVVFKFDNRYGKIHVYNVACVLYENISKMK